MNSMQPYNHSAIMHAAWNATRAFMVRNPNGRLRSAFARYLREAWVNARTALRSAVEQAALSARTIAGLQTEIAALENTDTLGHAQINRMSKLRAALVVAQTHEAAAKAYAEKRALIAAASGRFCAVTFIKADGTQRTMQVQPATLARHVKGDAATDIGKRTTQTRKARHPHLLPVWDAHAKAPRSVNLATISRIAVDRQVHEYRM